jgi:DNA-binding GntR family transcriptional regulator
MSSGPDGYVGRKPSVVDLASDDPDKSQSQSAYEGLRRMVREGRFKFGTLVSEQALAEDIGVGRTPIREAVSRLAHEGLLHRLPKRGVMIRSLNAEEVRDLYDMRESLEVICARRAVENMTSADMDRMAEIIESSKNAVANGCSWLDYREIDREFHSQLWYASRNKRLIEYIGSLHDAAILDLTFQGGFEMPDQGIRSIREHTAIYEALVARDIEAVVNAVSLNSCSYQKVLSTRMSDAGLNAEDV